MRRRAFIAGAGSAAFWPLAARAQQADAARRIGFLSSYSAQSGGPLMDCFRKELVELGWVEGKNLIIEERWVAGKRDLYAPYAAELVGMKLDVIATSSTPAAQAMKLATRETKTPVVFVNVSDPVTSGIVSSLSRPGGNITGISNYLPATTGKLVGIVKQMLPGAVRVAVLRDPFNAGKTLDMRQLVDSGRALGISVAERGVSTTDDIEQAFRDMSQARPDALIVLLDGVSLPHRDLIVRLAAETRLVTVFQAREFVEAGGLMSYGLNVCAHFRRGAFYVDKVLRGEKPADLPVELPTTFELVINSKTAKALGLSIPTSLLATADEVIE